MDYPPQQPYRPSYDRMPTLRSALLTWLLGRRESRRFSTGGCIGGFIALIVVVFVLFILTVTIPQVDIFHVFHPRITGSGESTVLSVSDHPTLVIDSEVTSSTEFQNLDLAPIHIQAAAVNQQITINAGNIDTDPNDGDNTNVIVYNQTQDGAITTLQVRSEYTGAINITVPTQTDLKISTLDNSAEVVGVMGQMVLQTNSGALTVQNSTLSGASVINSNSGTIQVEQSTLDQAVTLNNNSGPITFSGRLNALGNYRLVDNSGRIEATLSNKDAFHLDAMVNSGTIAAEFPGVTGTSTEAHGDIGKSGRAQLFIYDNSGSIKIQKA